MTQIMHLVSGKARVRTWATWWELGFEPLPRATSCAPDIRVPAVAFVHPASSPGPPKSSHQASDLLLVQLPISSTVQKSCCGWGWGLAALWAP